MRKAALACVALFLLIYILPLGVRPLVQPDETRYGEIPREMLSTGEWIVPHLDGGRYFEKPVLGYWLNAISIFLFGENAFAVRFPSAVAAGLSALLVFLFQRKYGDATRAGLLGAAILLTCGLSFAIGVFAVLDSAFALFVTASLVSFYAAHRSETRRRKNLWLSSFGVSCGLAFLTKGLLAFALVAVVIIPFLVWERRSRDLWKIPWIPMAMAAIVALPWYMAIAIREPDFWNYFFWIEHIKRYAFADSQPQHPQPFWYFLPVLVAGALPWTSLFPAAAAGLWKCLQVSHIRFAICWFLFPFLFVSVSEGELSTYILPCFAPLAILLAAGLTKNVDSSRQRAFGYGAAALGLVIGMSAIGAILHQAVGLPGIPPIVAQDIWKARVFTIGLLVWGVLVFLSARARVSGRRVVLFCAGPVLFFLSAHFLTPQGAIESNCPGRFLLEQAHRIESDTPIATEEPLVHSVCWFFHRSDIYILETVGELAYGLSYEDSKHRLLTLDRFRARVCPPGRGTGKMVLIARTKRYEQWCRKLPEPLFTAVRGKFVFAEYAAPD